MLASRGKLDLDAPVADLWPEFATNGKERATTRMMLDHSVGLPALRAKVKDNGPYEWDYMTGLLADEAPFWEEVREGYRFLRGQRRLFAIILLTYSIALVGTPYSRFLPVFATDVLHAGPSTFGLLLAAPGAGAVMAGLGIASLGRLRRRLHFVAMSVYAFSLFLILFSFCRSLPLSMLFLVLVGASNIAFRSVANSVVQMETPPHLLGRMLSLFFMDKGMWSFGTLFIGSVAQVVGTPNAIAISGVGCALAATILLYQQRQARGNHPVEVSKRRVAQ